MLSRAACVLLLALPLSLSGCIAGTQPLDTQAVDDEPLDVPDLDAVATVHDSTGELLPLAAFGGPLPVADQHELGFDAPEPTIGVTSNGHVFTIAGTTVLRSTDGGATWEDVTPKLPTGANDPPTTNDPYLFVDTDTDRVFVDHMYALTCSYLSWTDDEGETWETNPVACGVPYNDHQTIAAGPPVTSDTMGYPNILYYCWNSVAYNACSKSLDGGRTFVATGQPAQLGVIPGETGGVAGTPVCGGLHGHVNVAEDGSVYIGKGACGKPYVLISRDEGQSWHEVLIADVPTSTHDVDLAIDDAGIVYAVWRGNDMRVWSAYSVDRGETWATPKVVSAPGIGSTFMPVIAAGDIGQVAIGYIGTEDHVGSPDEAPGDANWYAYVTISQAMDQRNPTLATARGQSADEPVHVGPCIGRCGAFVDFHDIVVGPRGTPYMATASCLDDCRGSDGGSVGGGIVVTLRNGPSLR